jgi:hypothetical protein
MWPTRIAGGAYPRRQPKAKPFLHRAGEILCVATDLCDQLLV